jgi:transcription antitermination factor NusG
VRYSHDVLSIVGPGNTPAVVSDELVASLKAVAECASLRSADALCFSSGEHVQIANGVLSGLDGVILNTPNHRDRVGILLSILGCGARLSINRGSLTKAM